MENVCLVPKLRRNEKLPQPHISQSLGMYKLIQLPLLLMVITPLMSYREPVQSLFLLPEKSHSGGLLLLYRSVKHTSAVPSSHETASVNLSILLVSKPQQVCRHS